MDVAVVGCGLVATKKYFPALRQIGSRARLVGLCDVNESLLSRAAESQKGAKPYVDLGQMLDEVQPDVVVICTPPRTHKAVAVQVLSKGSHVLIEKPMATTVEECDEVLEVAAAADRKVGVMHNQLYNLAISKALDMTRKGDVGAFLGMQVLLQTPTASMTAVRDHWSHKLPGGVLGETGPHAVYLSLPWTGRVEEVSIIKRKVLPDYPWSIAEDIRFHLVGEKGISTVTLLFSSAETVADVHVFGATGTLRADIQARGLAVHRRNSLRRGVIGASVARVAGQRLWELGRVTGRYLTGRTIDAHKIGLEQFMDHVEFGKEFVSDAHQGREVVRVMQMLVRELDRNVD
jgi:predicted dehydrogenase